MNYYKNNATVEQDIFLIPGEPVVMNYKTVPSMAHDSLVRCTKCHIKYDMHDIVRMGFGEFVCKFCLNQAA